MDHSRRDIDSTIPRERSMTTRSTFALLATFGLVGALAAGVAGQDRPDGPAAESQPQAARVGQVFRVPYRLTDTNHYLVRVRINGKGPFNFLVDSGAPALFVGTEAAGAIGLKPAPDDYWTDIERLDIEGGATADRREGPHRRPVPARRHERPGPARRVDRRHPRLHHARPLPPRVRPDRRPDDLDPHRLQPEEPFIPRALRTKDGPAKPAEVRAMEHARPDDEGHGLPHGQAARGAARCPAASSGSR